MDGLTIPCGTARPQSAEPAWEGPEAIACPAHSEDVLAWRLRKIRHPFGARIVNEAEHGTSQTAKFHWDRFHLMRSRHMGCIDDGGTEQLLVSVVAHYAELIDRYRENVPAARRIYPSVCRIPAIVRKNT